MSEEKKVAPKRLPLRRCVACRRVLPKAELLKVVKNKNGEISVDAAGKAPGRGAYVCSDAACRAKCVKAKLFNKAFKCAVPDAVYGAVQGK